MPPKKAPSKTDKAKAASKIEDKTFGLKNKKGSKQQKFVQSIQQQAANNRPQKDNSQRLNKEAQLKEKEELNELFKTVQTQQKVPFGVSPKTILCQYFKLGTCTKGKNCKFSHDVDVERKSAKIDLYTDTRQTQGSKDSLDKKPEEAETMEQWSQQQLEDVVGRRHGKNPVTTTDIVCKYFIDAVESRQYGWFWQCPNGADCKYRHALPPGYQLKEHKRKKEEQENIQSLEEWIEEQRSKLTSKLQTPVTLESFQKWKQERIERERKELAEAAKAKEAAIKAGRAIGASGKDLFTYNPEMYNVAEEDDEDVWQGDYKNREEDEENEPAIDEELFENLEVEDD